MTSKTLFASSPTSSISKVLHVDSTTFPIISFLTINEIASYKSTCNDNYFVVNKIFMSETYRKLFPSLYWLPKNYKFLPMNHSYLITHPEEYLSLIFEKINSIMTYDLPLQEKIVSLKYFHNSLTTTFVEKQYIITNSKLSDIYIENCIWNIYSAMLKEKFQLLLVDYSSHSTLQLTPDSVFDLNNIISKQISVQLFGNISPENSLKRTHNWQPRNIDLRDKIWPQIKKSIHAHIKGCLQKIEADTISCLYPPVKHIGENSKVDYWLNFWSRMNLIIEPLIIERLSPFISFAESDFMQNEEQIIEALEPIIELSALAVQIAVLPLRDSSEMHDIISHNAQQIHKATAEYVSNPFWQEPPSIESIEIPCETENYFSDYRYSIIRKIITSTSHEFEDSLEETEIDDLMEVDNL